MIKYSKVINISLLISTWFTCLFFSFNTLDEVTLQRMFIIGIVSVIIYGIQYIPMMSPSFFIVCFYIMLFFIQPIYQVLYEIESGVPFNVFLNYTILTISGIYLFMIGACLMYKKSNDIELSVEVTMLKKIIKFMVIFMLFQICLLFIDAKTINILALSRYELKNGSLLREIANFGIMVSSILYFMVGYTRKTRNYFGNFYWIVFMIVMEILVFFFFRTRTMSVSHISSFIAGYYFSHQTSMNGIVLTYKSSLRSSLVSIKMWCYFIILFFVSIISRFLRGYLEPGNSIEDFQTSIQAMIEKSIEFGDTGYANVVMLMIKLFPNSYEYLLGQSYYRILLTPIPRFVWPNKPINTESIIGSIVSPEILGYSLPPGIQGDLYINFGLWGILGMFLYGIFFSSISHIKSFFSLMLSGISAVWIFHLSRGGFTNPIIIFLVLYFASKIIDSVIVGASGKVSLINNHSEDTAQYANVKKSP